LSIHSDQGRHYESQVFQELCEILKIRKTRTTPSNPKYNGQVERFKRSLLSMIKSFLRGEQTNWNMNLGCLEGAYRASPHESTGLTPNLLMLGREIRLSYEVTREGHDPHRSDTNVTLL
jgi:transposase InsO family protein